MMNKTQQKSFLMIGVLALLLAAGCASEEKGNLSVLLEPEDTITEGLAAGSGTEQIQDGWDVSFEKYIAVIGDVLLQFSTDQSQTARDERIYAVDLVSVPANGEEFWRIEELENGSWEFSFALSGGIHNATQHSSVSDEDFAEIVDNDWSYLIKGSLQNNAGISCPPKDLAEPGSAQSISSKGNDLCYANPEVAFRFALTVETLYGPCEIDGIPGVAIPAGGTATAAITIHGDHVFFNGFPTGSEGGIMRLAQWLADCDLNLDGQVTQEELESIAPADLSELDDRYQLGGSILPLNTMWDYVASQLKTQGHYQGEGECPPDGMEHDHAHDDDHADEHDGEE